MKNRICTPIKIPGLGWLVHDSYMKMYVRQTQPPFKTKYEANKYCKKLNREYEEAGIKIGDKYGE